jgi:hypothetical protein
VKRNSENASLISIKRLADINAEEEEILRKITEGEIDIHQELVVSGIEGSGCGDPGKAKYQVTEEYPGYIRIQTDFEKNSWMMWSQTWYPGWKTVIDEGSPVASIRADYLFQAQCIPEGKHEVEFIYQPFSFYVGAGLTLMSLLILGIIGVDKQGKEDQAR